MSNRCRERACVWPAHEGQELCNYHRRMFSELDEAIYKDPNQRPVVKPVSAVKVSEVHQCVSFVRHGYSASGNQRLRCRECRRTRVNVEQRAPLRPELVGFYNQEAAARAMDLFISGESIRNVAASCGISKATAQKIRARVKDRIAACMCGKPGGHLGWCRPRFMKSQARQARQLTVERLNLERRAA